MNKTGRTNTQIYVCGVGMGRGEEGGRVRVCRWVCERVSGWVGVWGRGEGLVSVRRWVCERVCGWVCVLLYVCPSESMSVGAHVIREFTYVHTHTHTYVCMCFWTYVNVWVSLANSTECI